MHSTSLSFLILTLTAVQLLYYTAQTLPAKCSAVVLIDNEVLTASHREFNFSSTPSLPSDLSSNSISALTMAFWHKHTGAPGTSQLLRVTMDDTDDEASYKSKRVGYFLAGTNFTARSLTSNTNNVQVKRYGSSNDDDWLFSVIGVDPTNNRLFLWTYLLHKHSQLYENTAAGYDSGLNWNFDTNLKIYVGGDTHLGNYPQVQIAKLICYPDLYDSADRYRLIFGNQFSPRVALGVKLATDTTVTDIVTAEVYDLSDDAFDPTWDAVTESLDFSISQSKRINIVSNPSFNYCMTH